METRASSTLSPKKSNGRACVACHQRKVRCDILEKGSPCSNCVLRSVHSCLLYEKKKTRSRRAQTEWRSNVPLWPRGHDYREPASVPPVPTTPVASWMGAPGDDAASSHPRPSSAAADETHDDQSTNNLAEFLDQEDVRAREITKEGRLYFIGTEFSNLNYLVRQRSERPARDVLHFGSHPFNWRAPAVPQKVLQLPPRRLCDSLIRAFFDRVNRGFPFVDERDFMNRYHNRDLHGPLSLLLLNAVLLVGAHVSSPVREGMYALKADLFHRTKTLFDARFEEHREVYLQVSLLLTWQCVNLEDIVSNSWHWVGVAARTALGMGMHRNANPSSLNTTDKRQWIRWWWTLFQFDVVVSTAHGRPQAIHLDDADVPDLNESHFEGIPHAESAFAICHTRLCIIFSKAMRKRVALRSKPIDRAEATRQADSDLAQFITHLPQRLRLSRAQPDVWQAVLHLTYNNFLVLLHRPPPQDTKEDSPGTASDLSICSDAVSTITSIFEGLRAGDTLCDLWPPSLYVIFTALVHVTGEARSTNPVVAAKAMSMFDFLILTLRALSRHWIYAHSLLCLFDHRRPGANREKRPVPSTGLEKASSGPGSRSREEESDRLSGPGLSTELVNGDKSTPSGVMDSRPPGPTSSFLDSTRQASVDFHGAEAVQLEEQPSALASQSQRKPWADNLPNYDAAIGSEIGGWSVMPSSPALDFLLAGMDNEWGFLGDESRY